MLENSSRGSQEESLSLEDTHLSTLRRIREFCEATKSGHFDLNKDQVGSAGFYTDSPNPSKELKRVGLAKAWAIRFLKFGGYSVRLVSQSSDYLPLSSVDG
ncbi:hypothetical protein OWV82_013543 [Melia azedarach]|uniref:Uncharacterized protein n=1 Tax=Melia azedarach TaxID=155640 RepID=A0ACC1XXZ7_MELAZ|nr:hypothetical protein OWV82_013543 [Melia azedarach]